jgi:hypothetical protein
MKFVVFLLGISLILVLLEMFLRLRYGFGHPLLYLADPEMGYLLAPNQSVRRFGNRIHINQYSMRSDRITPQRPDGTLRILMLGDSIVNGGWWTDQSNILSELVARQLQTGEKIEVLNASANSWAPRNQLAYIQNNGLFESQIVVLVLNTDDLFATTPSPLYVGHDRNYPDRKPILALTEVIHRYLLPAPELPAELKVIQSEGGDRVGANLAAVQSIHQQVQQSGARFLLVMTPLRRELDQVKDYELVARQRLLELTQRSGIAYIDFLSVFNNAASDSKDLYHDHIHLSVAGNILVSNWISQWMLKH